ncbi:hypothetical protein D3C81_1399180 [compost metagenome]
MHSIAAITSCSTQARFAGLTPACNNANNHTPKNARTSQLSRCTSSTGSTRLAHSRPTQASSNPLMKPTLHTSTTRNHRRAETWVVALAYLRPRLTQNSTSPLAIITQLTSPQMKYNQRIG